MSVYLKRKADALINIKNMASLWDYQQLFLSLKNGGLVVFVRIRDTARLTNTHVSIDPRVLW